MSLKQFPTFEESHDHLVRKPTYSIESAISTGEPIRTVDKSEAKNNLYALHWQFSQVCCENF